MVPKREKQDRRTRHIRVVLLMGLMLTGCAAMDNLKTMGMRIDGHNALCRWHAADFRAYTISIEEREVYEFTLVLEETHGQTITFTQLEATFRNNPFSRHFEWQKEGTWTLPAHGELRLPLGSYRYCPELNNCKDWGPLAPVWHVTLTGTDRSGHPVQLTIDLRLPYQDDTASHGEIRLDML